MKWPAQGVLPLPLLTRLLTRLLLLTSVSMIDIAYAENTVEHTQSREKNNTQKHIVAITYPLGNILYADIAKAISKTITKYHPHIKIASFYTKSTDVNLMVTIGMPDIQKINSEYSEIDKLFISTGPAQNKLNKNTTNNNATLFMTQPYCRQMKFISLLNKHWNTISYLNTRKKSINNEAIEQCAAKHNLSIQAFNTKNTNYLTESIKNALSDSDILLALPNKNIYNKKTVKNILLTSYRYRKPVIAFSKSFVNAGALAAIHSNAEQIAQSASILIEQYFSSDKQFKNLINYPDTFDISLNKQVFRALDITIPDSKQLKYILQHTGSEKTGKLP